MSKFLFIIPNLDENITGASKRSKNIAFELSKSNYVRVLSNKNIYEYQNSKLIKKNKTSFIYNLYLIIFFRYDAWFSDHIKWSLFPKRNLYFTLHDMKEYTEFNRRGFIKKIILRIIILKSKYLITVSENQKRIIKHSLGTNSKVVLNSISKLWNEKNDIDISSLQSQYNINRKFIIYVSNFTDHKNHLNILTHTNLLDKFVILLIGTPQDRGGDKIIEKLEKMPMIRIVQNIDEDRLICLVKNCEFSIFPSRYEGFGMPILEAISQGKNVLVNNELELDHFKKCDRVKFISFNKTIDEKDLAWAQTYHSSDPKCISNKDWSHSANEILNLVNV